METRSACSSKAHAQRQYYDKLSNLQFQVSSLESQYDQLLKTFRRLDVPPVNGIDKVNTKQKALACILRRVHKQLKMMRSALREETTRVICVRTTCTAADRKRRYKSPGVELERGVHRTNNLSQGEVCSRVGHRDSRPRKK